MAKMGFGTLFKWEGQIFAIENNNKIRVLGEKGSIYTLELSPQAVKELVAHPMITMEFEEAAGLPGNMRAVHDIPTIKQVMEKKLLKKVMSIEIKK